MDLVTLYGNGWSYGPVGRARTFKDRLLGLRQPGLAAVLIRTRSVHGIGLDRPFLAVGLTNELRVAAVRRVGPGRVVRFPGCSFVLELPVAVRPPLLGSTLEMADA